MNTIGRRAVGLCMLCALLVSAFAAQSASAATNGTTAIVGGSPYSGKTISSGGQTLLHSVISGVMVELKSTELVGSGEMESMLSGSEHTSNGTGTMEYKNVVVTKPEAKGCKVKTGAIKTNTLKLTTAGQGMGLKIEPASGATGTFAKYELEGCTGSKALEALNGLYESTGSVVSVPEPGGTVVTAAGTTAQGTLKVRGQNSGMDGKIELKTEGGTAIQTATVETP